MEVGSELVKAFGQSSEGRKMGSHAIQIDNPQLVGRAIEEVLLSCRKAMLLIEF